jgi:diguanylate cyclase (GGDEF)-like protein
MAVELQVGSRDDKKFLWLKDGAGTSIDALELALNSFSPKNLESLISLRQHIRGVLERTRDLGMPAVAAAAQGAMDAGALNIRGSVEALIGLLRKAAHAGRNRIQRTQEADPETGLLNVGGFVRRLAELERDGNADAAVGAIQIADAEALSRQYGDDIGRQLVSHVGKILSDQLREEDQVARMRGFEFAVLLPAEDNHGFQIAMTRIESAIANVPFQFPDGRTEPVRIKYSGYRLGIDDRAVLKSAAISMTQTIIGTMSGIEPALPGSPVYRVGVSMRNEATSSVLGSLLARAGYDVISPSGSGRDRMKPFATSKVHVVIVDDATTTLPALRTVMGRRRTPVIAIADTTEAGQWAIANGAREFLLKPVHTETLVAAVKRLVRRGKQDAATARTAAGNILLVSDEVGQLIALGSALQKQGGYMVYLGRGPEDASAQIAKNPPAAVVLDLSVRKESTVQLLASIAALPAPPCVILVVHSEEQSAAAQIKTPVIAGIIAKPVALKTFHVDVQRFAATVLASNPAESQEILRAEILRVMRSGMPATVLG